MAKHDKHHKGPEHDHEDPKAPPPLELAPEVPAAVETAEETPKAKKAPKLPAGVEMVQPGAAPKPAKVVENAPPPDPTKPPPGWVGSWRSCGACGDFIGNERFCKKCSPHRFVTGKCNVPANVSMSSLPKPEAK